MSKEEEDPLSKCTVNQSCKCRHSSSLYHKKLNKLLRKIKSSDQSSTCKECNGNYSVNSSSINIFERSLENPLNFTNPNSTSSTGASTDDGIPLHYKLENFTNPILDITTDYLSDPNVDFNDVKLNYYDDDDPTNATTTSTTTTEFPSPHSISNMNEYPFRARSRSRSIISNNLLNTLSQSSNNTTNSNYSSSGGNKLYRRNSSFSTVSNSSSMMISPSKRPSFINNSVRPRQQSVPGTSTTGQSKTNSGGKDVSIDFYSFADMLSHEDEEEEAAILESILNHHINDVIVDDNDGDSDDDNDDGDKEEKDSTHHHHEVEGNDIEDEKKDQVSNTVTPARTRTGSLSIEDKIALTNALPLSPSLRRSSYTTMSVKDYIGVL